ncbi:hypothetical protein C8Q73DRAFT_659512, partial [Cubamyces lactineus]
PSRPPSPDLLQAIRNTKVWRDFAGPPCKKLAAVLYAPGEAKGVPDAEHQSVLGQMKWLTNEGFSVRDGIEHMHALINFMLKHEREYQVVDQFVDAMKMEPHWPAQLKDKPQREHADYAWLLLCRLLTVLDLKPYIDPIPPPTFAGITPLIFPPIGDRDDPPTAFNFTLRELVDEGFIIETTSKIMDHLVFSGRTVQILTLSRKQVLRLMCYSDNVVARAVGLDGVGKEILYSFGKLVEDEFTDRYRLPVSLGVFDINESDGQKGELVDDLTAVTSIIKLYQQKAGADCRPEIFASRVLAIEKELRRRRRWYNRLRRDVRKREREEPVMFWGTVLATFFGICSIIQTVTSIWSLVLALRLP